MSTPRTLLVYYSRSGTTKRAAEHIAALLGADVEPLVDTRDRSGVIGYLRSGYEAMHHKRTRLEELRHDLVGYDLVVVGSPVWVSAVSSPVRTFLEMNRGRFADVAFFCTCGGRGGEIALEQMKEACGAKPEAVLVLRAADVKRGLASYEVTGFVAAALRGASERVAERHAERDAAPVPP